ncbi:MAG: glycosyltransferase family 4 protein [Acetobacteraceae bacterium]|nr:glycosyltransferase family 4 protein [Acetobacteraceae bacterium]
MPLMTPERVLLTTDTVGGVWRYTLDLASLLRARNVDVSVATLGPGPTEAQRALIPAGARLYETDLPLDWVASRESDLSAAGEAIAALARRERVDLVHLHAPAYAGLVAWPVPVVSVAHSCLATWWEAVRGTAPPEDFRWRTDATARGLRASDAVIAPSAAFAASLRRTYGEDLALTVVHNARPRRSARPGPRERAVITAGRLWDEGKNVATLDRAAARLVPPIYAAGPTRGPNGAQVKARNLHLLGVLDERRLEHRLASTMVFASPARYEPFGLGVLEAAQLGAALVLSDIPTFRELWPSAALFVDHDDAADLCRALGRLLDDPPFAAQMAARARMRARDFSLARLIREVERVYAEAVRGPRLQSVA